MKLMYHEWRMRRALSILLVLFFGFGPLAATLGASDDAGLPACCRRNGAHHCAMSDALQSWMLRTESRMPGFTAPSHCPLYPSASPALIAPVALAAAAAAHSAPVLEALASIPYHASVRSAALETVSDRGPPTSTIA
jgi:hypothetical protein